MARPRTRRFDVPDDDASELAGGRKGKLFDSQPPKELQAVVLRKQRRTCGEHGIGLVLTPHGPYVVMVQGSAFDLAPSRYGLALPDLAWVPR